MRVSKEVRIGLLVFITGVILFTGFYLLKGADLFSTENKYYCYYTNLNGLINSSPIQLNGLNVGHIAKMELAGNRGVKVTITLSKTIQLTKGTIAGINAADLLGSKSIKLTPGPGPEILKDGEELLPASEGGAVENISGEITPRLQELKSTIIAIDTALAGFNAVMGAQNQKAIAAAIQSIVITADNLAKMSATLNKESGEITSLLHNANSISANLANSNDTIKRILSHVNNITGQLANSPIQKTLTELQSASASLESITKKINNNEGSLGMLINNKDMYNNLNSSIISIHALTDDLKAHPGRYINVSVFGKKSSKE